MNATTSATIAPPSAQPTLEVRQIPLAQLAPSPANPRKTMDECFLAQLADSIRQLGVQVPLLVRPSSVEAQKKGLQPRLFEIVAGHRRHLAAQRAGLEMLPCIVRTMTDSEALEVMLVENLQRADLNPMEEAQGYKVLIRAMGDPDPQACVEAIARKVGKQAGYVRARLKLLRLIEPAREALREGLLGFDTALLIAKLEDPDQERAAVYALCGFPDRRPTAAKELEDVRARVADERKELAKDPNYLDDEERYAPRSAAAVKAWIAEHVLLDLANVPWPLESAQILPEAGACTTCTKRAGSDAALFADLTAKADTCTDPACFDAKKKAFVQIQRAAAKASGKPLVKISDVFSEAPIPQGSDLEKTTFKCGQWVASKEGACSGTYPGLTNEGEVRWVCVLQTCKVHKHNVRKPASRGPEVSEAEQKRRREEEEKRRKAIVEHESAIREAIWSAIFGKLDAAKALRLVADKVNDAPAIRKKLLARFPKANGLTLDALTVFWGEFALALNVNDYWMAQGASGVKDSREDMWRPAKRAGVNADALAAQHFHAAFPDAAAVKAAGLEDLVPKGVKWPSPKPAKSKKPKAAKKGGKR